MNQNSGIATTENGFIAYVLEGTGDDIMEGYFEIAGRTYHCTQTFNVNARGLRTIADFKIKSLRVGGSIRKTVSAACFMEMRKLLISKSPSAFNVNA